LDGTARDQEVPPGVDAGSLRAGDPTVIGPYAVVGRLGAGGMGVVYLARGTGGRLVAVKVIRRDLAADPEFRARFRREAEAARRVAAFCTARVLDAELEGPSPYLVTEYIHGVRLDRAIAEAGALDASSLEGLAVGVAAALAAIHTAGLVHRDLKPNNVLLSPFGPRVIDFGIARALDATSGLTQTGAVLGSLGWMAPEQLAGAPVTPAADVFAWGGLVLAAATGGPPFGSGPPDVIAHRILAQQPDLGAVPESLRGLAAAALHKDPGRRPTARALLDRLLGGRPANEREVTQVLQRTWVKEQPPTARAAPPPSRWPAPRPLPARRPWYRRKGVLVFLGILLLLAALSGANGRRPAEPAAIALRAPARDGRFEFVATDLRCGETELGGPFLNRSAQGQYCLVDVTVRNVGTEPQTLEVRAQRLYDESGNRYDAEGWMDIVLDTAFGGWTRINPGNRAGGVLVFDIPAGARPAHLELHDSLFSAGVDVDV
jgi:predicted Ser/Thr protein kinase